MEADGVAGPLTLSALYQASPTGQVGTISSTTQTLREEDVSDLIALTPEEYRTILGVGKVGNLVKKVQQMLVDLGFQQLDTADGVYGPKTEAAVRAFQQTNGVIADGEAGPKTYAALQTALSNAAGITLASTGPMDYWKKDDAGKPRYVNKRGELTTGALTWIGDSLSARSKPSNAIYSGFYNVDMDAMDGKRIVDDLPGGNYSGLNIAASMEADGTMSDYLVFELGTNVDTETNLTPSQKIDRLINTVGSDKKIILFTNYAVDDGLTSEYFSGWNAEVRNRAANNRNIALVDWASRCSSWKANNVLDYYLLDGVHQTTAGAGEFVRMVQDTLVDNFGE